MLCKILKQKYEITFGKVPKLKAYGITSEIQILKGVYSHLSTLDDLTKEISSFHLGSTKSKPGRMPR